MTSCIGLSIAVNGGKARKKEWLVKTILFPVPVSGRFEKEFRKFYNKNKPFKKKHENRVASILIIIGCKLLVAPTFGCFSITVTE